MIYRNTRIFNGIIASSLALCTYLHSADTSMNAIVSLWKTDLFNRIFQYCGVNTSKAIACTCKTFNKKSDSFYTTQNSYVPQINSTYNATYNGAEENICTISAPSIMLSSTGKEFSALVVRLNEQKKYDLVHTAGFVISDNEQLNFKRNIPTVEYNTKYSGKCIIFDSNANTIPGYRDPKGKFFLFLAADYRYGTKIHLLCFSRNTGREGFGQVEDLGEIHLSRKSPQIDSVEHDSKSSIVTLKFKGKRQQSVIIDLTTKKIIEQRRSFTALPTTEQSGAERMQLVEFINQKSAQTPLIKDFCKLTFEEARKSFEKTYPTADLYVPSIVLGNDNTTFKALGISRDADNPKSSALPVIISGLAYINHRGLVLEPSRTIDGDTYCTYPYSTMRFLQEKSDGIFFPGFCDDERRCFIFPAEMMGSHMIRGDFGEKSYPTQLMTLHGEKVFEENKSYYVFDTILHEDWKIDNMQKTDDLITFYGSKKEHDKTVTPLTFSFDLKNKQLITDESAYEKTHVVWTKKVAEEAQRKWDEGCAQARKQARQPNNSTAAKVYTYLKSWWQ